MISGRNLVSSSVLTHACTVLYEVVCAYDSVYTFVGSCLAPKVFIGNLPAMGRGWVNINRSMMNRGQLPTR